ncbi:hypothetical protein KIPB_004389 [Kipferlia bialata]|uniref:Uncharacterized protein n=1 Tax=Kipferlia bialata TaxID=797122 RepID=A0A9K3CTM9_9EUKA|nr:hypothetical protein KIPB_004389 [Kipferlia bialata]|eukprot:g4389.t1
MHIHSNIDPREAERERERVRVELERERERDAMETEETYTEIPETGRETEIGREGEGDRVTGRVAETGRDGEGESYTAVLCASGRVYWTREREREDHTPVDTVRERSPFEDLSLTEVVKDIAAGDGYLVYLLDDGSVHIKGLEGERESHALLVTEGEEIVPIGRISGV